MPPAAPQVRLRPEVAQALTWGRPVVALESTLIAHGLPRPDNLTLARELEQIVRDEGAVPATVAVIGGVPSVGLSDDEIERIATSDVPKLSVRDLAAATACGSDGATTVASTALLAARAGIRLFATGGLGGVHRGARETWDESADLVTLSRTAIAVVCAGVKSILDVGATLERLESLNVGVIGYGTRQFPGFYLADSGYALDWSVDSPEAAAAVGRAHFGIGLTDTGLVIANPIPVDEQLDPALHQRVLEAGLAEVQRQGMTGKRVTPFLLDYFRTQTGGASVQVNLQLVRNNVRLAARIAGAM
jgi:pseudouridine-5'-phosphate glycosidase